MSITEKTPLLAQKEEEFVAKCGFRKCLISVFIFILIAIIAAETWYVITDKNEKATLKQLLRNSYPLPSYMEKSVKVNSNMMEDLSDAVFEGKKSLFSMLETDSNTILNIDDASYRHQHSISNSKEGVAISRLGFIENEATKVLRRQGYNESINYKDLFDFSWTLETNCFTNVIKCNLTKYRSITGVCNNINNSSSWGVAMNPYRRSLPASYKDGISEPRGGFLSTDLPNSRLVSSDVHRSVYKSDDRLTVMLATYGQFIDHDITATALTRSANEEAISCCSGEKHPECFPVILTEDDDYRSQNVSCMEFVRSAPALVCSFGPREQLNQASSYIDGSVVYGNTDELSVKLRSFNSGQLKMTYTESGRELLPFSEDANDACNQQEEMQKGRYCFLTGDTRANENTYLTSMHLIWARHHNLLASQLSILNPEWNDETIFQEVRRILSAQLQHITFNEFLPPLLGAEMMEKLQLNSLESGYWTGYNESVDSSISNSFATAAFRFAHSLIPGMMKMMSNNTESFIEIRKMLFNPYPLYEDGQLEKLIISASETSVERADSFFTSQLTQHLFESSGNGTTKSCGLDLVALNIQRGRDHGLPGYSKWREYCGFGKVESFDDLNPYMDSGSLQVISSIYENVDDIDLYTGAVSEIPVQGGMLGPTFTCLIADQFYRIKKGDRFWYETNEKPQAFTEAQLSEIRNSSLGSILCLNSDNLEQIQTNVMKSIEKDNDRISCNQSIQLDLTKWMEPSKYKIKTKLTKLTLSKSIIYDESNNNVQSMPNITGILWSGKISINKTGIEIKGTYEFGEFEAMFKNKEEVNITKVVSVIDIYSIFQVRNGYSSNNNQSLNVPIVFHASSTMVSWNGECTIILNDVIGVDEKGTTEPAETERQVNVTGTTEPPTVHTSEIERQVNLTRTTEPSTFYTSEIERQVNLTRTTESSETERQVNVTRTTEPSKTERPVNVTRTTEPSETERQVNVTTTTEPSTRKINFKNYDTNELNFDEKEKEEMWKFGKYMIKVTSGKLLVHLKDDVTLEWWNGVLPEIIELPVKAKDESAQYTIEWSFEAINKTEGNATFHTYNVKNELEFLGDFIFSLYNNNNNTNWNDKTFDNFLTTNTTFFSPIYYYLNNSINITDYDVKSDDVFCPVVLLGHLSDDKNKFFWNKKVLVTFMNLQ